ncbi:MAG: RIP metalloprotease RseP [Saprospiraceae bacterium]
MGVLIIVSQLILSLSILIVLHEFGHFLPARAFKIKVEKFYLFFDPWFSLFKKKIGDTEWGIGWLPLGGYVKIAGMIDESMDKEQMKLPAQPWEFRSKPAWQRLIVMLGGVTVNFILGVFIYSLVLFNWGESYLPTENATFGIYADSLATQMGLQTGDKILSIDNKPVENFNAVRVTIFSNESKTIQIARAGEKMELNIPTELTGKLASYKGMFIDPLHPCDIESVPNGTAADSAGVKANDQIIGINNQAVTSYQEVVMAAKDLTNRNVGLELLRGEDTVKTNININENGKLGFIRHLPTHYFEYDTINYSLAGSFPAGYRKSVDFLGLQINAFGQMFRGKVKASESLGGFRAIGEMFGTTWDWRRFWYMTAILSLILGFMNLLPIPALDGGHVMFLLYEMITGRAPSEKVLEYSTIIGFVLIISLVLYANINDWL